MASKTVTWQVNSKGSANIIPPFLKQKQAPQREKISRRDQPTWANCKLLKNNAEHRKAKPRATSARTPSRTSTGTYMTSIWTETENVVVEAQNGQRGREVFRRKAKKELSRILPTQFKNFDASDLKLNKKLRPGCKSAPPSAVRFTEGATSAVAPQQSDTFFFNGVQSSAYRRPSVQFSVNESDTESVVSRATSTKRRSSEPAVRRLSIGGSSFTEFRPKFSARRASKTCSTSAPATLASNEETAKVKLEVYRPPYLDHDWRSEILSRYATSQPWVPKVKTTRYFPKFSNLQDVNCRNPYLIPNGLLYNAT